MPLSRQIFADGRILVTLAARVDLVAFKPVRKVGDARTVGHVVLRVDVTLSNSSESGVVFVDLP